MMLAETNNAFNELNNHIIIQKFNYIFFNV